MTDPGTAPELAEVDLDWYVNAKNGSDASVAALVARCEAEATELVSKHVGTATVPAVIIDRAVLEVGADLFYRRAARNGIVSFGNGVEAASVIRINRDPMTQAYPLLAPYLGLGFA